MASRPTGAQIRVTAMTVAMNGAVIVAVVVAVMVVWLVGLVWFRPWIAHNDFAIFRIALERELDGNIRLVGAHSRLDVFHPGPLREWVFAVPYWLSGRRAAALPATSLALNAVWAIWITALAHRLRPRAWGVVCAIGLLVLVIALGPDLASPWNPHLAILPMYLACWATVSVLARRGEGWVACIVAASFAAQLHASVLVLGGALLVAALAGLAVQRLWMRTAGAVGLGLLLWSGPIIDLRKGAEANLVRLGTVGADGESVGLADAVGHVSRLVWPGTPLGRLTVRPNVELLPGFHRWWLLMLVFGLIAAMWWSLRRPTPTGPTATDGVDRAIGSGEAGEPDVAGGTGASSVAAETSHSRTLPLVAGGVALGVLLVSVVSVSLFVEPAYRYLYGPLQAGAVFAVSVAVGFAAAAVEQAAPWSVPYWLARVAIPLCIGVVFITVPRLDGASEERGRLDVEEAVRSALDARPGWTTIEAIPLDLRGAGDLDAEVLDVAVRSGVDARSRRTQLGLPGPDSVDGVFGVAMSPALDCLLGGAGIEEIVRGTTAAGEPFAIVAVDRESVTYDECIGEPLG